MVKSIYQKSKINSYYTSKLFLPRLVGFKCKLVSSFTGLSSFFLAMICPPTLLMTTVNFGGIFGSGFFFLCCPDLPQPIFFFITYLGYECDVFDNSFGWSELRSKLESPFWPFSCSLSSLDRIFFLWSRFRFLDGTLFLHLDFADVLKLGCLDWSIFWGLTCFWIFGVIEPRGCLRKLSFEKPCRMH